MASDDTEITLGVGKLLGLFFLLAAICGIFFSIGYSLGKSSGREQALNDQPAPDDSLGRHGIIDRKQSQAISRRRHEVGEPGASSDEAGSGTPQQGSLTFYNAVKQNDNAPQRLRPEAAPEADPGSKGSLSRCTCSDATTATAAHAGDVMSHTSPVTGPGTIVVQIAAVSREDDAVSLAGALRKKNYNVFVVNNPVTNDKFYHVQVGPFSTMAEAEAMKAKLVAEGYNPIIKR